MCHGAEPLVIGQEDFPDSEDLSDIEDFSEDDIQEDKGRTLSLMRAPLQSLHTHTSFCAQFLSTSNLPYKHMPGVANTEDEASSQNEDDPEGFEFLEDHQLKKSWIVMCKKERDCERCFASQEDDHDDLELEDEPKSARGEHDEI